jgi:hypothetical protein
MRYSLLLALLCGSLYAQDAPPARLFYTGTYQQTFSSPGTIKIWRLYDDGTMEGNWVTANGSISMNVRGTYKTTNDVTIFMAQGQLFLPDKEVTSVTIMGVGKLTPQGGSGSYILHIDTSRFHDDYGTWTVTRPEDESTLGAS